MIESENIKETNFKQHNMHETYVNESTSSSDDSAFRMQMCQSLCRKTMINHDLRFYLTVDQLKYIEPTGK